MKPTSDWRSVIKVHPAADLFPMMSPEELRALGEDIKMNGLKVPPETWLDEGGTEWLIDGRNRLDALASLGYRFIRRETRHGEWTQHEHLIIYEPTGRKTVQVRQHGGDPCELATSLNITRRHLTTAQKSELILGPDAVPGMANVAARGASPFRTGGQIDCSPATTIQEPASARTAIFWLPR